MTMIETRERERRLFKSAMLFMIPVAIWDNLQHRKLFANQVKINIPTFSSSPSKEKWLTGPTVLVDRGRNDEEYVMPSLPPALRLSLNHKIDGTDHSPLTTQQWGLRGRDCIAALLYKTRYIALYFFTGYSSWLIVSIFYGQSEREREMIYSDPHNIEL